MQAISPQCEPPILYNNAYPRRALAHGRLLTTKLSTSLPVADVAVDNLIRLALLAELAGRLDGSLGAVLLEIIVCHDFTTHKLVLKVRVDDTSSLRCLDTVAHSPGADLLGSTGKVADEVERRVARGGDLAEGRGALLAEAKSLALCGLLLVRHGDETLLKRDGEGNKLVSRVVLVDPALDLGEPLVLFPHEVLLGQVDEVGDGLGGQEGEAVDDLDLLLADISTAWQEESAGTLVSCV